MDLPADLRAALAPLFETLPLDRAMDALVVARPAGPEFARIVEEALRAPALAGRPALAAGLWLYVDELDRSHAISQGMHDATGSYWHGIMHRREGDFGNSHYWFHRAGRHPALASIPDHDPHAFVDAVAEARGRADTSGAERQRREWAAMFEWCARQPVRGGAE